MDEDPVARVLEEMRDLQREGMGRGRKLQAAVAVVIAIVLVMVLVLLRYLLQQYA